MKNMNKLFIFGATVSLLMVAPLAPVYAVAGPSITDTPVVTTVAPTATVTPTATQKQVRTAAQIQAAALDKAKEVATGMFNNQFLKQMNELKVKVQTNTKLGTEAKNAIVTRIDSELSWFTAKRDSISGLTTVSAVRLATQEARERFVNAGKEVRRMHIAGGFVTSLEKIITNLEANIFVKIDKLLTDLSAKGLDVAAERTMYDAAKSKLALAKAELPIIRNSTTFEEAKAYFDTAKGLLKEVRTILSDMATSLKTKVPMPTVTVTPSTT